MSLYKVNGSGSKKMECINEWYKFAHREILETKKCECRQMTDEEKVKYGVK